jgi:hypothetical protein
VLTALNRAETIIIVGVTPRESFCASKENGRLHLLQDGTTPVFGAALNGHTAALEVLLAKGGDPNQADQVRLVAVCADAAFGGCHAGANTTTAAGTLGECMLALSPCPPATQNYKPLMWGFLFFCKSNVV